MNKPDQPTRRKQFKLAKVDAMLDTGGGLLSEFTDSGVSDGADDDVVRWLGLEVGSYRIVEYLDRGGMSLVFKASRCDGEFDQAVAVKILRTPDAGELAQRFERERQLLARLEYPGIAHIIDSGVADGEPWIAMELVDGMPIDQYSDQHQLTIDGRLDLFAEAARAVQFAHGQLIVHRDLKPSNILVTDDGRPKLLDFGIGKALQEGVDQDLTGSQLLMTPMYASPEQVLGEPIGVASDVYQLGLLLYRLLTGGDAQRLEQASVAQIKSAVVDHDPMTPSALVETTSREDSASAQAIARARGVSSARLCKQLNGDLDAIVLRALAKEPTDRYATVQQLLEDIENYQSHLPVNAQPPNTWYRTKRFVQRHRGGVVATVLTSLVLLVSLLAVGVSWRQTLVAQQQALIQAKVAQETGEFLTNLLAYTDPGVTGGDELTVAQLLDRSTEQVDQLASNPEVQARLLEIFGNAYFQLSKTARAEEVAKKALAIREANGGPVAPALRLLIEAAVTRGDFDSAETFAQRALAETPLTEDSRPDLAAVYKELSDLKFQSGDYAAQREHLMTAKSLIESVSGERARSQEAEILSALGINGIQLALYPQAKVELESSLALLTDQPHDRVMKMYTLRSLGSLHERLGDDHQASEMLSQSLDLGRQVYGERSAHLLGSMVLLGRSLGLQNRLDEAEALFTQAVAVARETIGEEHGNYARILFDYGLVVRRRGELERYRSMQEQAERIALSFFGDDHSTALNQRKALAMISADEGRFLQALEQLEGLLPSLEQSFGEAHIIPFRTRTDIATLRMQLGQFVIAKQRLLASLATANRIAGGKFDALERHLNRLSRWHRTVGSAADALGYAEQAAALRAELGSNQGWSSFWNRLEWVQSTALLDPDNAAPASRSLFDLIRKNEALIAFDEAIALAQLAPTFAQLGQADEARWLCTAGLARLQDVVDLPVFAYAQVDCAQAALHSQRRGTALALLGNAVPAVEATLGVDNWQAQRARLLAAAAVGDLGAFDQSLSALRQQLGDQAPALPPLVSLRP